VVAVGFTTLVPESATVPIPGLIETLVAFLVVQLRVELPFAPIDVGLAVNVMVGAVAAAASPLPAIATTQICSRAEKTNRFHSGIRIGITTPE
jgi:hypothetical protein